VQVRTRRRRNRIRVLRQRARLIQYFEFHVPGLQKAEFPLPDKKNRQLVRPATGSLVFINHILVGENGFRLIGKAGSTKNYY
jgi:hypothetical protein